MSIADSARHAPRDILAAQKLTGRTAIVTGAGGGIGAAACRSMAERGARIVGVDLQGESLRLVLADLPGEEHLAISADVTDEEQARQVIERTVSETGRLDILVNSAGVNEDIGATVTKIAAQWQRVIDIDLTGTYLMAQAAGRVMVAQGSGVVLNLSSIAGVLGLAERPAYSAAKAGVVMLTRVLAAEWGRNGVRVNSVSPGYVRTAMTNRLIGAGTLDPSRILRRTPMGEFATPEDVAEALAFLASDQAAFITGVDLPVDGGYMIWGAPSDAHPGGSQP